MNYPNLFLFIDEAAYTRFLVLEHRPFATTEDGLDQSIYDDCLVQKIIL